MKSLNVIEAAYRGTLEEQDDTVVWISHAMYDAGATLDVLLRGNAVNYAVRGQSVEALKFGSRQQKNSPQIAKDVAGLVEKGIAVFALQEDIAERGIDEGDLIYGLSLISRKDQAKLYDTYDQVWHW